MKQTENIFSHYASDLEGIQKRADEIIGSEFARIKELLVARFLEAANRSERSALLKDLAKIDTVVARIRKKVDAEIDALIHNTKLKNFQKRK